ncbi:phytoene/squalene synthase family protein [Treponema sp. OMZ 792]|uniref:phytoene/squalene synthase family protein n=1 Tax=unclassified Treponema TaxID=2638727 RepID=UPI0020A4B31B|nr:MULTISPECIES: phytoene/squalene synthase family protein [unclassified Treponema]UTC75830.1 phytoene/squalene synthase family protein [Treponema sp. OMZ 792]UTC78365.1 squalene/phytoene synthase family protein [Treponema sp. OMZ 799]UTC79831.1 squalene/phytoene synthase family protein [Treponema sp. OMZ 798]
MKERAVSFYQAFSNLPPERFKGVAAVYAFCRYADDLVDKKPIDGGEKNILKSLLDLENALKFLYSKESGSALYSKGMGVKPNDNPVLQEDWWPAFEHTVKKFDIPLKGFLMQIEGQRMDLSPDDIKTFDEFIEYCRLVASSVGLMMLPFLVKSDKEMDDGFVKSCEDLGIAMQITNILRDVGEDLREKNKLYLPASLLEEYGITKKELEDLARQSTEECIETLIPQNFILLWEKLASIADDYYASFGKRLSYFHPSCVMPLFAAARMYRGIADAVREASYNCFTKRCYTTEKMRNAVLAQVKELKQRI